MVLNDLKISTALTVNYTLGVIVASSILIYGVAIDNGVVPFDQALTDTEVLVGGLNEVNGTQPIDGYTETVLDIESVFDLPTVKVLEVPEVVTFEPIDVVDDVALGYSVEIPEDLVPVNFASGFSYPEGRVENPDFYNPEFFDALLEPGMTLEGSAYADMIEPPVLISGVADFVSSDVAMVDETLVHFEGVHGPSSLDMCETAAGHSYNCGDWSVAGMRTIIDGRELSCTIRPGSHTVDGAREALCTLTLRNGEERNVAEIGLESGILVLPEGEASEAALLDAQEKARTAGNGVWSGVYEYAKSEKDNS